MKVSAEMDDEISKSLNMVPLSEAKPVLKDIEVEKQDNVDDDFEYARGNLISVIEKGQEALNGILDVAGMSQHPRSYEVVSGLIKTLTDANKDLLQLSKQHKDLKQADKNSGPQTVNNNLFVGSTAELQKMLKGVKEEDNNE
jgi:hypothetical protein